MKGPPCIVPVESNDPRGAAARIAVVALLFFSSCEHLQPALVRVLPSILSEVTRELYHVLESYQDTQEGPALTAAAARQRDDLQRARAAHIDALCTQLHGIVEDEELIRIHEIIASDIPPPVAIE